MSDSIFAFTMKANGRLQSIVTPITAHLFRKDGTCVSAQVNAVWDTGATRTCVSSRLASILDAHPLGYTTIHTANGATTVQEYEMQIELQGGVRCNRIRCCSFNGSGKIDVLVGMDLITSGDLSITNADGKTCVSFRFPPDYRHIDYQKAQEKGKQGKLMQEHIRKKQV